jgi:acyl-CoA thioester hydrolase
MDWDYPQGYRIDLRVSESDIDGLDHTNNAVYVKWCERAAWAHSVALGLDLDCYRRLDRAMAITRSEFDYLAASRLGDEVTVSTWIVDWDRRLTMERHFQVIRGADAVTLMRGKMKFACIEISSGKPRRLPPEFIAGYGAVVLSDQPEPG